MEVGSTVLSVFDFYRVMLGTVTAELVFVEHAAGRKEKFAYRMLLSLAVLFLLRFPYQGLLKLQTDHQTLGGGQVVLVTALWWLLTSTVSLLIMAFCYEITPCNLLFQCIFGLAVERLASVFLQYLICKKWFPSLQTEHFELYLVVTVLVYGTLELFSYLALVRWMPEGTSVIRVEDRKTFLGLCAVYLFMSLMGDLTSAIFEWSNSEETRTISLEALTTIAVPYYCIIVNVVIAAVIILMEAMICRIALLQEQKRLLLVMQKEKEQQYRFSRENVDLINQKCHDLKRQIRALKLVKGEDRDRLFAETEEAIQFYDARIQTGNEALDTLLTEKSFYCAGQKIRFGCNVQTKNLGFIDTIDLYTMLSNALDNAIECVSAYEDTDKRIVNVAILERGSMLHFFVDNYFEGTLKLKGGLPVTVKKDKDYHGYGVKSMQMLAKKYDGTLRFSAENHTFSLQIMMPLQA